MKRSEIASTIAHALPLVFAYAERHGVALAGLPFTRYIEMGPGLVTLEPGMRIAASGEGPKPAGPAPDDPSGVVAAALPGGPIATTTHIGPYESLPDAYASIQQWMESHGLAAAGAPWEC